ncbi:acyltransferase [Paenibacillus ginsengarvi]|uniref:Acyltransferase n=1 Tax=Paenibacillus ginsengarvi TaxID=400777 RepID=A0A3B0C7Z9_9BACL|nr:acyltransferase [Paenibacillus ginsengarvi]RKN82185.1 acyltransferase [Paenibacillus ginsengarvi]
MSRISFIIILLLVIAAIISALPFRKLFYVKKVTVAFFMATVMAFIGGSIIPGLIVKPLKTPISITALDLKNTNSEGSEVWIKKIIIDGRNYKPTEIFKSNWIKQGEMLGWKNYDQPEGMSTILIGELPYGENREIVFESNKWRGIVSIEVDGQKQNVDLYSSNQQSTELSFKTEPSANIEQKNINSVKNAVFAIVFGLSLLLIIVLMMLDKKKESVRHTENDRDIWADLLRIVSIFAIHVIHSTGSIYSKYAETIDWYQALFINSVTRFAVPVFMMISGVYILSKTDSIRKVITKRIPKVLIPLLFWSFCYALLKVFYLNESTTIWNEILQIPITHRYYHLWFIYQLIGFYLISPILAVIYHKCSNALRWYFVAIALVIPSFMDMIIRLAFPEAPTFLQINWSRIGIAELGLFFLGKLLYDYLRNHKVKNLAPTVLAILGLYGVVMCSYYMSVKFEKSYFSFFEQIRFPVLIFSIGVFSLFYSLEQRLRSVPNKIKILIRKLSTLTLGVYFVHPLAISLFGNSGIISLMVNFIASFLFCYVLSKVPYLRRMVT